MPKRINPHNAEFQKLLHRRGKTLGDLAKQLSAGGATTHVHICQVVNGQRIGRRTIGRLKEILPEDEWEAVRAFRAVHLGKDVDSFLDNP